MQLHVSVIFTSHGNVKTQVLRGSVTFPPCLSQQISAIVRFHRVSANGFTVVCYIYQNTNRRDGSLNNNES